MLPRRKDDDNKDKLTNTRMVADDQPNEREEEQPQHQKANDEAAESSSIATVNAKKVKMTGPSQATPLAVGITAIAAVAATRTTNTTTSTTKVDPIQQEDTMSTNQKFPFPWKLHTLLEDAENEGYQDIVSWDASGTSFRVHKPIEFCASILGRYFRQSKYESFTRQCEYGNLRKHQKTKMMTETNWP
jgi:HSF-type DNA-binding